MSPNETLFLESTNKIVKDDINNSSFVQFQIWDFPGQIDFFDPAFDSDMIFGGCGALVFVIDAQVCLSIYYLFILILHSENPSNTHKMSIAAKPSFNTLIPISSFILSKQC